MEASRPASAARALAIATALSLGTSACARSETGSKPLDLLARAWCERRHECRDELGFPFADLESCIQFDMSCSGSLLAPPDMTARCTSAVREADCDALALRQLPDECEFQRAGPTAAQGEACGEVSCEEGTACDWSQGLCGVCQPLGGSGEACAHDGQCLSSLCRGNECAPPGRTGERCSFDSHCEGYCNDEGLCGEAASLGAPCEDATQCPPGTTCREGACREATPYHLGDPCESDCVTCISGDACYSTSFLCVDGRCELAPAEGEDCEFACRAGMVCVDGTCTPYQPCGNGPEGAPCLRRKDCADGMDCREYRCTPKARAGEPCLAQGTITGDCAPGLYCADGDDGRECRPSREVGEPCNDFWACLSGFCDEGLCAPSSCR